MTFRKRVVVVVLCVGAFSLLGLLGLALPLRAAHDPDAGRHSSGHSNGGGGGGNATCPAWLAEYERFHAAHRGRPDAKYLVHRVGVENGGLGDRLRGMMFAARLAAATSRVLLFSWSQPHEVTAFLAPATAPGALDWRVDGTGYDPASRHPTFVWLYDNRLGGPPWHEYLKPKVTWMHGRRRFVLRGGLSTMTDQWVTLSTNEVMDSACTGCPPLDAWGADAVCLWHRLFRLLPEIHDGAERVLRRIYGGGGGDGGGGGGGEAPLRPYVAVHLRLGGFAGEPEAQERGRGPLQDLVTSLSCAQRLAAARHANGGSGSGGGGVASISNSTPLLMVTDSDVLRGLVQSGRLVDVVTSPLTPVHLERAQGLPREAHLPTFIELVLLARAQCLVLSDSGFSHQAFLAGKRYKDGCTKQLSDCFLEP